MDYDLHEILCGTSGMREFIKNWQSWGEDVKEDVFKFFCYYTAFNHIYNYGKGRDDNNRCKTDCNLKKNCFYLCDSLGARSGQEKCNICNTLRNLHADGLEFKPFESGILSFNSELVKEPIHTKTRSVLVKVNPNDDTLINIQRLFINIYYIRCNLYHGSKTMNGERDKPVVNEATRVLEYLLKQIVKKYCN